MRTCPVQFSASHQLAAVALQKTRLHRSMVVTKFKPMKHTMPTGRGEEEKMLMKMMVISEGFEGAGRVVGCHMVGADAGEMMQGIAIAMKAGASKDHFDSTVGIHPTAAEEWCTMRTKTRTTTVADVVAASKVAVAA